LAQSTVLQAELITTYHDMCIGQYADIRSNVRARSALSTYRQFVLRKTNGPFSLAFAAAARYGGQGVDLARALGRRLGTAYQMANDHYDVLLSDEQERGAKRRRILTLSLPIAIAIDAGFLSGETLGTSMDDRAYEAMMQAIRESNVIMKTEQELEKSILATIRMAQEVPCWTQAIDALCRWIRSPVCWDHHEIGNAGY
jgi:geranylgeranyl pyrophosphate synthase